MQEHNYSKLAFRATGALAELDLSQESADWKFVSSDRNIASKYNLETPMQRNMLGLAILVLVYSTPLRAETLKVMAAGSLRAVVTDLLHLFPLQSDTVETPEFGPSGLMRQKIENGASVDVFASADMEQPHQLAVGHPGRLVILFARNSLCALGRSTLGLDQANLLDRLLDPAVRIATSTPGSDPLGTYSWQVFARAEALKPGARATLEAKAKMLVGGGEKTPPLVPGKGAVEGIFLSDQADVMLIYCSAVPALQNEMPFLSSIKLPASLTVEPANGMIILDSKPVALRFVAFVMSEEGQSTLRSYGFEPVASASPTHP
jgi:molybdate transport system substrate-binding protein